MPGCFPTSRLLVELLPPVPSRDMAFASDVLALYHFCMGVDIAFLRHIQRLREQRRFALLCGIAGLPHFGDALAKSAANPRAILPGMESM